MGMEHLIGMYYSSTITEQRAEDDHSFSASLMPMTEQQELDVLKQGGVPAHDLHINAELRRILDETSDFLESRDFIVVQRSCLDHLFSTLLSSLDPMFREAVEPSSQSAPDDHFQHPQLARFTELAEKSARLVNLLPAVSREGHAILKGSPNEYVEVSFHPSIQSLLSDLSTSQILSENRELQEYAAVVFVSHER